MEQFFKLTPKISSIEDYNPEKLMEGESYHLPDGYDCLDDDVTTPENDVLKIVTVMVTPERMMKAVLNADFLELEEAEKVTIITNGKEIVSMIHPKNRKYVYYKAPLWRKYSRPKFLAGANMAGASFVAGYLMTLFFSRQQMGMGAMITQISMSILLVLSLVFMTYYFYLDKSSSTKLKRYLQLQIRPEKK